MAELQLDTRRIHYSNVRPGFPSATLKGLLAFENVFKLHSRLLKYKFYVTRAGESSRYGWALVIPAYID